MVQKDVLDTLPIFSLEEALAVSDPLTVYKLSLKRKRLSILPQSLKQFKNLQYLDISKNRLERFPEVLLTLQNLQYLNIASNKMSTIPQQIQELSNLQTLIASQNVLTTLPSTIGKLNQLEELDLWGNEISWIPQEIAMLKNNLLVLDLRVMLLPKEEHKRLKELLPTTKIHFSKTCDCAF